MFTKRGTSGTSENNNDSVGDVRAARAVVPPASSSGPAPLPPRQPAPPAPRAEMPARRMPEPPQPAPISAAAAPSVGEQPRQPASEQGTLIVGRDISMAGEIRSCDRLIVEGTVEAALNDCRALEVADSGLFRGAAEVDTADISGNVDGDLIVQGRLIVRSTGKILGSLRYGEMEIERGGQVVGGVELVNEPGSAEKALSGKVIPKSGKEAAKA